MMLNKNSKNIFYLFSVEFIVRLLGFFAVAYLARTLSSSGFGTINIGLGVLSYAMIITIGGLNLLGVKKVASGIGNIGKLSARIISSRITLSIIVLLIFIPVLYFIFDELNFTISLLYLIYLFPAALLTEWYFQGKQNMGNIAAGRAIGMAAYLLLVLVLVQNPADIIYTPIAWIIGIIINVFFLFLVLPEEDKPNFSDFKSPQIFLMLKESFPLSGATIIAQVVIMFPVIFIGISIGDSEAGLYSAAFKIITMMLIIDRVFNSVFYPKIVGCINNTPQKLNSIFNNVLRIISFISVSAGLILLVIGEPLLLLVFGEEYISSLPLFHSLLGYFVLTLFNSVFTYTLIGMNKEKIYVAALSIGGIIFFIAGIILTQYVGTIGMAISLALFEVTTLTYMIYKFNTIKFSLIRSVMLPLIFTFVTAFCVLELLHLSFILELLIVFVAIAILAAIIKIGKEEINFVKQVLL